MKGTSLHLQSGHIKTYSLRKKMILEQSKTNTLTHLMTSGDAHKRIIGLAALVSEWKRAPSATVSETMNKGTN